MKIKSIIKQPTLPNDTRFNNSNKPDPIECRFQTKTGYSYSEKELDEFSNSIISPNSPPAEEIKKYIKLNIELLEIQSLKTNFNLNQNNSLRDQISQLFVNYNELKRNYDTEVTEFNGRINEFILKEEKLLKEILDNHKIEQQKFNQKWSDPEFINSYNNNKQSTALNDKNEEENQEKIKKFKEIELRDLISSQKDQISKFNANKYKYLEYLKMENQKRLKNINCSLNQIKTKSKFIISSKNFLIEIENQIANNRKQSIVNFDVETLNNQKGKFNNNIFLSKSQFVLNKKQNETNENKTKQKKTKIPQSKSQLSYLKSYSSTLNMEMSNVFKNNKNIVSTENRPYKSNVKKLRNSSMPASQLPKLNQGIISQRKNVFAIKQPSIKKPELPTNKNLNILNTSVKKQAPIKNIAPFQIKKLGDLKEPEQITPENNIIKVEENKKDINQQSKNKDIKSAEYDKKFRDNVFFVDYKKYKFTKKNPFTDNIKKNVFI